MSEPSPSTAPSAVLVQRARKGDQEAYDRLFASAAERLRVFIRLRLGPKLGERLDEDDVLQEAYLLAHRDFESFHYTGEQAFLRWVCRIVENRIRGLLDHFDAKKRRPPGPLARVSQLMEKLEASRTGPVSAVARREQQEALSRALGSLEQDEREALLLRFFQDLTVDEIAHLMSRTPSATRRLLGRATRALGQRLGGKA